MIHIWMVLEFIIINFCFVLWGLDCSLCSVVQECWQVVYAFEMICMLGSFHSIFLIPIFNLRRKKRHTDLFLYFSNLLSSLFQLVKIILSIFINWCWASLFKNWSALVLEIIGFSGCILAWLIVNFWMNFLDVLV